MFLTYSVTAMLYCPVSLEVSLFDWPVRETGRSLKDLGVMVFHEIFDSSRVALVNFNVKVLDCICRQVPSVNIKFYAKFFLSGKCGRYVIVTVCNRFLDLFQSLNLKVVIISTIHGYKWRLFTKFICHFGTVT